MICFIGRVTVEQQTQGEQLGGYRCSPSWRRLVWARVVAVKMDGHSQIPDVLLWMSQWDLLMDGT